MPPTTPLVDGLLSSPDGRERLVAMLEPALNARVRVRTGAAWCSGPSLLLDEEHDVGDGALGVQSAQERLADRCADEVRRSGELRFRAALSCVPGPTFRVRLRLYGGADGDRLRSG